MCRKVPPPNHHLVLQKPAIVPLAAEPPNSRQMNNCSQQLAPAVQRGHHQPLCVSGLPAYAWCVVCGGVGGEVESPPQSPPATQSSPHHTTCCTESRARSGG
eukprot:TRINITY_DN47835_c0_g1_i1.p1 TRINITY_DN47835_c0_g1~~TRINITY_DN47835_c0_g1_i1.p1  ORF type:complete len:102 (-),score=25.61 TRINITY_DN47835_c0_g1_i1:91-396(-)